MAWRSFRQFVEQELGTFPHFVVYALLEWALMVLLFISGILTFLSNEFARFFDLKAPCLLCTRIDHRLVGKNSSFYYNDSICEAHKRDVSSLAYCHIHRRLSDIKTMCEGCLLSFATERESDTDTYKSIVGILHKDIDSLMEDDLRSKLKSTVGRKEDVAQNGKSIIQRCSCCGEPLKMRLSSKNLTRSSSVNPTLLAQGPAPSPRASTMTWKNEETRNLELPHIRYTELKLMPDNELGLPDDESGSNLARREENKAASVPLLPESDDIVEEPKTPSFSRGSKFFGIPLTDSASASPRWASRLSRKFQLEKTDLVPESNGTNATNETDSDSILNRLKKQVRLDRKSLIELYMELDEERSASAVAANNAMAMITRLQAEKAAVQMEALQYQRMMEEQAEYDEEAIQVMKDLLMKREEELKVVEGELDTYREKYGPINRVGSETCEVDDDENYQEFKSQSFSSMSERSDCGSLSGGDHKEENGCKSEQTLKEESGEKTLDESPLDYEGERSYFLGLLTDLERKLNGSSDDKLTSSDSDMIKSETDEAGTENNAILMKEVSIIRERLRAIEADSGFLKHTAMTLQKGGEGTKLLMEIASSAEA